MDRDFLNTFSRFDKPAWLHPDEAERPTRCDYCNLVIPTDEYWASSEGVGMCGPCHTAAEQTITTRHRL